MIKRCSVFPICLAAIIGCAARYTTRREPACPAALVQTRFVEDSSSSGVIAGTVLNRDTGQPIADARVQVAPQTQSATSDSNGGFSLAGLAPGQHVVTVLRVGFERHTDTVTLLARRSVRSQIALTPSYADRCMEITEVRTPLPWWHFW